MEMGEQTNPHKNARGIPAGADTENAAAHAPGNGAGRRR